jgi:hypothetical protein
MSVLILGMEMPKDCVHCSLLEGSTDDGLCHAANKWMDDEYFRWYQYPEGDLDDSKPLNCPLVPLPAGHGRLIDADAFKADCLAATKEAKPDFIRKEDWLKACAVTMSFCRDIDERPTIVPAEGGNADG